MAASFELTSPTEELFPLMPHPEPIPHALAVLPSAHGQLDSMLKGFEIEDIAPELPSFLIEGDDSGLDDSISPDEEVIKLHHELIADPELRKLPTLDVLNHQHTTARVEAIAGPKFDAWADAPHHTQEAIEKLILETIPQEALGLKRGAFNEYEKKHELRQQLDKTAPDVGRKALTSIRKKIDNRDRQRRNRRSKKVQRNWRQARLTIQVLGALKSIVKEKSLRPGPTEAPERQTLAATPPKAAIPSSSAKAGKAKAAMPSRNQKRRAKSTPSTKKLILESEQVRVFERIDRAEKVSRSNHTTATVNIKVCGWEDRYHLTESLNRIWHHAVKQALRKELTAALGDALEDIHFSTFLVSNVVEIWTEAGKSGRAEEKRSSRKGSELNDDVYKIALKHNAAAGCALVATRSAGDHNWQIVNPATYTHEVRDGSHWLYIDELEHLSYWAVVQVPVTILVRTLAKFAISAAENENILKEIHKGISDYDVKLGTALLFAAHLVTSILEYLDKVKEGPPRQVQQVEGDSLTVQAVTVRVALFERIYPDESTISIRVAATTQTIELKIIQGVGFEENHIATTPIESLSDITVRIDDHSIIIPVTPALGIEMFERRVDIPMISDARRVPIEYVDKANEPQSRVFTIPGDNDAS
eukprot:m.444844 g.444844  ORF g.444844 m.444844 type:complete len:645 (-) comp19153_c0_seq1:1209-3143(-)